MSSSSDIASSTNTVLFQNHGAGVTAPDALPATVEYMTDAENSLNDLNATARTSPIAPWSVGRTSYGSPNFASAPPSTMPETDLFPTEETEKKLQLSLDELIERGRNTEPSRSDTGLGHRSRRSGRRGNGGTGYSGRHGGPNASHRNALNRPVHAIPPPPSVPLAPMQHHYNQTLGRGFRGLFPPPGGFGRQQYVDFSLYPQQENYEDVLIPNGLNTRRSCVPFPGPMRNHRYTRSHPYDSALVLPQRPLSNPPNTLGVPAHLGVPVQRDRNRKPMPGIIPHTSFDTSSVNLDVFADGDRGMETNRILTRPSAGIGDHEIGRSNRRARPIGTDVLSAAEDSALVETEILFPPLIDTGNGTTPSPDDALILKFKNTEVLKVRKSRGDMVLSSGGWRTVSTRLVLNNALKPLGLWIEAQTSSGTPDSSSTVVEGDTDMTINVLVPATNGCNTNQDESQGPVGQRNCPPPSTSASGVDSRAQWTVVDGKFYLASFQDGMVIGQIGASSRSQLMARASVVAQHFKQAKNNALMRRQRNHNRQKCFS